MFNLGVLDTAIAVVIVLLLLSLIVQSIQTFLKKVTRFKSRQIAASLENALDARRQRIISAFRKSIRSSGRAWPCRRSAYCSPSRWCMSTTGAAPRSRWEYLRLASPCPYC